MPESPAKPPPFVTLAVFVVIFVSVGYIWGTAAAMLDRSATRGSGFLTALQQPLSTPVIVCGILSLVMFLAMLLFYAAFLWHVWKVVQDGHARMSPGTATSLAVIPGVHFVGMFFGYWGLARELNRVALSRGVPIVRVSEGVALGACVLHCVGTIGGCIPLLGCFLSPLGFVGTVLWIIGLFQMARAGRDVFLRTTVSPSDSGHQLHPGQDGLRD